MTKTKISSVGIIFFLFFLFLTSVSTAKAADGDDCGTKQSNGLYTGTCVPKSQSSTSVNCSYSLGGSIVSSTGCGSDELCCSSMNITQDDTKGTSTGTGSSVGTGGTAGTGNGSSSGSGSGSGSSSSSSSSFANGIVPCGKSGGSACTLCHLIVGIQNLINWGKNILVVVAIVGIFIAGVIYIISSGSEQMITLSKNCFKASIVGFAITIAAWLVINTILVVIITPSSNSIGATLKTWNAISCDTKSSTDTSSSSSSSNTGSNQSKSQSECNTYCSNLGGSESVVNKCVSNCMESKTSVTGTGLSQSEAASRLDDCGVKYVSASTLSNVKDSTVSELCNFQSSSGCTNTVTTNGGTTGSHASGTYSHENGYKFDFRPTDCNKSYIKSNYTSKGTRSDGAAMYQSNSGACYALESDHWDMSLAACPPGK